MDSTRRIADRKSANTRIHERSSLDGMLAAGYDPTLDIINIPLKYYETNSEEDKIQDMDKPNEVQSDNTTDNEGYNCGKTKSRGGYDSSCDLNNPEYIAAKNIHYSP